MNPRSTLAFDFSSPQFSVIGRRPTAMSTFSAATVWVFPSLVLNVTVAPRASFFTDSTAASVKICMPFLRNALSSSLEISSSSSGTIRGSISRMVTSVPNVRKMDANSTPTAPAPTTTRLLGTSVSERISRFPPMVLLSNTTPGSDRASEPVASITFFAAISVVFPSFSTLTRPGPAYFPQPVTESTLFFLNSASMPLACFLTTRSFRAITCAQFNLNSPTSMPNSLAFLKYSYTSAWCSSTFVGMQPTCRQVPPRKPSFSMTTVFNPHSEARMAVWYPPGPLPIIARSYVDKRCLPLQTQLPVAE